MMNLFKSSSVVRNTLKLASSNILMYLLPILVTPILTRIYDPIYFGEWGIFSGLFSIINIVLFLCLENAIVKSSDDNYTDISIVAFFVSLVIVVLTCVVFLTGCIFEITFFETFPCKEFFISYLFVNTIYTLFLNIANKKEFYWVMAVGSLVTGLAQAALRIIFGYSNTFSNGLIAGTVFAQIIAALVFVFYCGKPFLSDIKRNKPTIFRLKQSLINNKRFPLYDAPASLLAFSAFNLPVIILSMYYEKSDIGCYSVILQLLLLPMSFIGTAIGKVYYQEISKENSLTNITMTTQKILKFTSVLAVLPMIFLVFGGDNLVGIVLGAKWTTAGSVAICLSLWSLPTILSQPLMPIYRSLNKQNNMLYFNLAYFSIGIGVLIILCKMGANMFLTLFVYACVCAIIKVCMFINQMKLANVNLVKSIHPFVWVLYVITFGGFLYRIINII